MKPLNDQDPKDPKDPKDPQAPQASPTTRPIRRSERQMPEADARQLLIKGEYGVLSTVDEAGWPYGVPVSYTVLENVIYFHFAVEGRKLENLAFNNKSAFTVVGRTEVLPSEFSTRYESVMAFGRTVEVGDPEEKMTALMALVSKYSSGFEVAGEAYANRAIGKLKLYKMTIEHMTGKERK